LNVSVTNIMSKCRIASIELDDAMILGRVANPDGSNFRKGQVMNFLVMPMFFLSGALFPLTNIPPLLRILVTVDPLSYGVDGMRTLLIDTPHFGIAADEDDLARDHHASSRDWKLCFQQATGLSPWARLRSSLRSLQMIVCDVDFGGKRWRFEHQRGLS
jgi:hypothetical protein